MPPKIAAHPPCGRCVARAKRLLWTMDLLKPTSIDQKKFDTDMAGVVAPLATFAGGPTLGTQLLIQCPDSTLEALLTMASQFFLATPLACLLVFPLLYGLSDKDHAGEQRRNLVKYQFVIIGLYMAIAFMVLAVAIVVAAQTHGKHFDALGLWVWY
jgi:hypothetical protein